MPNDVNEHRSILGLNEQNIIKCKFANFILIPAHWTNKQTNIYNPKFWSFGLFCLLSVGPVSNPILFPSKISRLNTWSLSIGQFWPILSLSFFHRRVPSLGKRRYMTWFVERYTEFFCCFKSILCWVLSSVDDEDQQLKLSHYGHAQLSH